MTYTFHANGEERTFTLREKFRIRDEAAIMRIISQADGDTARLAEVIIYDEDNLTAFCSAVFIGNFDGWCWSDVEDRALFAKAVGDAFRFFTGIGTTVPEESPAPKKTSTRKS